MMDTEKKTFVLVHGVWHGGWCYRHTAAALRKMGHLTTFVIGLER